jgi:hypothetical protein
VDWDNWITVVDVGGRQVSKSKFPETGMLVGISLVSNNKEFMKAARSLLGNANLVNLSPSRATLVVASQEGF